MSDYSFSSNYTLSSSPSKNDDDGKSSMTNGYAAATPRGAQQAGNPGYVFIRGQKPLFVANTDAFYAAHPETAAENEAAMRDLVTWGEEQAMRDRARVFVAQCAANKKACKEAEKQAAGLHGCVDGKKPKTCGKCAGNGCANGIADPLRHPRKCKDCEGKGLVLIACETCEKQKADKIEYGKRGWNKVPTSDTTPVCEED